MPAPHRSWNDRKKRAKSNHLRRSLRRLVHSSSDIQIVGRVLSTELLDADRVPYPAVRILANRLEHSVAPLGSTGDADQRLRDKRREGVIDRGVAQRIARRDGDDGTTVNGPANTVQDSKTKRSSSDKVS
jgi:hypothetical protein